MKYQDASNSEPSAIFRMNANAKHLFVWLPIWVCYIGLLVIVCGAYKEGNFDLIAATRIMTIAS